MNLTRKGRLYQMKRSIVVILGSLFWPAVCCLGASAPATLTSAVRLHKGLPALYVNGKLTSSLFFHTAMYPAGGNYIDLPDFLNAELKVAVILPPYEGGEKSFYWTGPRKYEFDKLDAEIEGYLKQDPQILLMPKIAAVPGTWWCREFPNEISLQSDGSPAGSSKEQPCHFSFASKKYRSLARDALIALVAHLESKFGNNMLGYLLENGNSGEWFSWDAYGSGKDFGVEDYSAPPKPHLKQWLRQKYEGNPKNLAACVGRRNSHF